MDRFRLHNTRQYRRHILILFFAFIFIVGCIKPKEEFHYEGKIDLTQQKHLEGRKILIDPGHGALGFKDGRIGPTGLREEEANLNVGLILASMLRTAGADTRMTRYLDVDISLDERVKIAEDFKPDLFISLHHNSNSHPVDKDNFPSILIWGNRDENPASYDFAKLLLEEFNKMFEKKGIITSDHAVFRETGVKVLQGTRWICPGALGEFGFFSDKDHELMLKDKAYNVAEAECYFSAISEYFKRGNPEGILLVNQNVSNPDSQLPMRSRTPKIWIRIKSGIDQPGIYPGSLHVTLNDIPVPVVKVDETTYRVIYGPQLYGGGYRIRFSFRNARFRSSPVLTATFAVGYAKDEFARNINEGVSLAEKGDPRQALEMLMPTLYSGFIDPKGDIITWAAARAFDRLGDKGNASYYYSTLYQFFPDSNLWNKIPSEYLKERHLVTDFYGIPTRWEKFDY